MGRISSLWFSINTQIFFLADDVIRNLRFLEGVKEEEEQCLNKLSFLEIESKTL